MKAGWMTESQNDVKWTPVVVLSVVFHLAVFSSILFIPDSYSARRSFDGIVYEVNLVEMPGGGAKTVGGTAAKPEAVSKPDTPAKRIEETPKREEKPVVIAKKTLEKETPPVEKPKESPADLLNKALSKIEKKIKTEEHLDKALANLENKAGSRNRGTGQPGGTGGGGPPGGTGNWLYEMEVYSLIRSNWYYPPELSSGKNPEATVVLVVKSDGTILKSRFEKRSTDVLFDESVLKAIERSNPLPPFPEGYRKTHEEIYINFNLNDLKGN
jgi:colicin import membrane protein